jgi:hypothetical protein
MLKGILKGKRFVDRVTEKDKCLMAMLRAGARLDKERLTELLDD